LFKKETGKGLVAQEEGRRGLLSTFVVRRGKSGKKSKRFSKRS